MTRASATRQRSAGSPSPDSPVRSAAPAGGCDHRGADGRPFDAVVSTCAARALGANAAASVASRSNRAGVAAAALASARQGRRDRRVAAKGAAVAVRARRAEAARQQLDVFSEFATAAADQQPQQGREGQIGERKEHRAMLPSPAIEGSKAINLSPRLSANELRSPSSVWYSRALVKHLNQQNCRGRAPNRHFETLTLSSSRRELISRSPSRARQTRL
jgi:hypothetical protein